MQIILVFFQSAFHKHTKIKQNYSPFATYKKIKYQQNIKKMKKL